MEHAVIGILFPDGPFEFADHEYDADWFSKDCIIKLFSRGVTAKSRLIVTREKTHQSFPAFPSGRQSVRMLPYGQSLNHCSTEQLKRKYR